MEELMPDRKTNAMRRACTHREAVCNDCVRALDSASRRLRSIVYDRRATNQIRREAISAAVEIWHVLRPIYAGRGVENDLTLAFADALARIDAEEAIN